MNLIISSSVTAYEGGSSFPMIIKNKLINIILLLVFIVSIITNIYLITSSKQHFDSIIGTYCAGDEKENGEYLTFKSDETYIHYKQFNVLSKGTYMQEENNVYTLKTDKQLNENQIIFLNDVIYYNNADNIIEVYKKISDTPVLININDN